MQLTREGVDLGLCQREVQTSHGRFEWWTFGSDDGRRIILRKALVPSSVTLMKAEVKSARVGPRNIQNFVYDFPSSLVSCSERIIVPLVVYLRMMVLAIPQFDRYQFRSKSG
jgi:hypothetical protein